MLHDKYHTYKVIWSNPSTERKFPKCYNLVQTQVQLSVVTEFS